MVHRNQKEIFAEDEMKQADGGVEQRGFRNFRTRYSEDVADEHVFQVFGFASGFTHEENRSSGRDRIRNPNECFLWNMAAAGAGKGEDACSEKRKGQADPIGGAAMRVHSGHYCYCGPEGGDLRESEVNEDHAAFDYVNAQVGVNAGKNQAGDEGQDEERQNFHEFFGFPLDFQISCYDFETSRFRCLGLAEIATSSHRKPA